MICKIHNYKKKKKIGVDVVSLLLLTLIGLGVNFLAVALDNCEPLPLCSSTL